LAALRTSPWRKITGTDSPWNSQAMTPSSLRCQLSGSLLAAVKQIFARPDYSTSLTFSAPLVTSISTSGLRLVIASTSAASLVPSGTIFRPLIPARAWGVRKRGSGPSASSPSPLW